MNDKLLSWEQAVDWLRQQPEKQDLVRYCYYDDPLELSAQRFYQGEEWTAIKELLGIDLQGKVLDVGAGRGISSYAFAKSGCQVVALEPDPSPLVGAQAIQSLVNYTQLPIEIIQEYGEGLPFVNSSFDIVYGRAVLHHAQELSQLCREAARVLKPGGILLATREHVISKQEDLPAFLESHALHHLYGGENAFLLQEYIEAIEQAGLKLKQVLGPWDSIINYAPMKKAEFQEMILSKFPEGIKSNLFQKLILLKPIENLIARYLSHRSQSPGRHYSFLAIKV